MTIDNTLRLSAVDVLRQTNERKIIIIQFNRLRISILL